MTSQGIAIDLGAVLRRVLCALIIALAACHAAAAAVPRAYAGIVIDAKTGKVLYESDADEYRYPASVTKVMTLYVLFEELAAGRAKLSSKMKVSKYAASAVPTKLGLKAGSTITVENAIKALVTLSANDIARVVAEYVSGSEGAFAKRMTATARALGMRRTTYANASGLPDGRQTTTVRDQSTLGRAVYAHFPKYYAYFQTKSFTYGKKTYGNHNNLLGKNGVDGIKTGYIRSSGYNLLTAARSGGKHVVVVAFGFGNAGARDAKVREMLAKYLPKARSGDYRAAAVIPAPRGARDAIAAPAASPAAAPAVEIAAIKPQPLQLPPAPITPPPIQVATAALAPPPAAAAALVDPNLGAPPSPLGATPASAPLLPPATIGGDAAVDLMTSGSVATVAGAPAPQPLPPQASSESKWIIQIGAAPNKTGASTLLTDATGRVTTLANHTAIIQMFEKDGQTFYRARFAGFAGAEAANEMCKQLKQVKMSCLAMQS